MRRTVAILARERSRIDCWAPRPVLLWQAACEFIAASRKLTQQGFSTTEAWDQLSYYLEAFPLILPSKAVLDRARLLHTDGQWSFWDAMLVSECIDARISTLDSEDLPGRQPPGELHIVNPFA